MFLQKSKLQNKILLDLPPPLRTYRYYQIEPYKNGLKHGCTNDHSFGFYLTGVLRFGCWFSSWERIILLVLLGSCSRVSHSISWYEKDAKVETSLSIRHLQLTTSRKAIKHKRSLHHRPSCRGWCCHLVWLHSRNIYPTNEQDTTTTRGN